MPKKKPIERHPQIPHKVKLGNTTIRVRFCNQKKLRELAHVVDNDDTQPVWAAWHDEEPYTLWLWEELTPKQQYRYFWHELGHAFTDVRDWELDTLDEKKT